MNMLVVLASKGQKTVMFSMNLKQKEAQRAWDVPLVELHTLYKFTSVPGESYC